MDQSDKSQQEYIAEGADQTDNNPPSLPDTPDVVATSNLCVPVSSTMQPSHILVSTTQHYSPLLASTSQHQPAYQKAQDEHMENVRERLRLSWTKQMQEMTPADFKHHSLPIAPIKRIMKADNDVRMIAQETAVLFAKACEMFILDITSHAWVNTEEDARRTVQKKDIAATILKTDIFDFLEHVISRDESRGQILRATNDGQQASSSSGPRIHGYNVPQPHGIRVPSLTIASGQQPPPFMPWYQPGPRIQQSFMPVPQTHYQQLQFMPRLQIHQSFMPVPQTQYMPFMPESQIQQYIMHVPQANFPQNQQLPFMPVPQMQQSFMPVPQAYSWQNQQLSFMPVPHMQQSFMPLPQAQSLQNQHQPFIAWPQAQQQLDQQTSTQFPISCFLAEQTPDQQSREQPSPEAEQQLDEENNQQQEEN